MGHRVVTNPRGVRVIDGRVVDVEPAEHPLLYVQWLPELPEGAARCPYGWSHTGWHRGSLCGLMAGHEGPHKSFNRDGRVRSEWVATELPAEQRSEWRALEDEKAAKAGAERTMAHLLAGRTEFAYRNVGHVLAQPAAQVVMYRRELERMRVKLREQFAPQSAIEHAQLLCELIVAHSKGP